MSNQRPRGRDRSAGSSSNKPSSGNGTGGVYRRGSGLGTGPVGRKEGYGGRFGTNSGTSGQSGHQGQTGQNAERGSSYRTGNYGGGINLNNVTRSRGGCLTRIIPILIVLIVGYFIIKFIFGGSDDTTTADNNYSGSYVPGQQTQQLDQQTTDNQTDAFSQLFDGMGYYGGNSSMSTGWTDVALSKPTLNTSVADGSREKYTNVLGNGKDQVTIMVYMCGTDLESKNGMGTADLSEMANARISDNVNLLVYTGGCSSWRNSIVSSKVNQIYQITGNGQVKRVVEDAGKGAMTSPDTLTSFINFCTQNYPANRQILIFWDHGGGSVSGYGYDEKNPRIQSMTLAGINTALKNAGTQFDIIGFDTCLMGTLENALMLNTYADYLIASEETEPGVGWYYTNWLTAISGSPSMSSLDLGKRIIDDFVEVCASKCRGQSATLSLIDLAELSHTVPEKLKGFSNGVSNLLTEENFKQVSDARAHTREFASSTKIDQIDLINFAQMLNTKESIEMARALAGAIKYNRTSSNMTNAYGLSIYFPYQKASYVDRMVRTYTEIGMDSSYSKCIQQFAKMETSGQLAGGGTSGSYSSLFDSLLGSDYTPSTGYPSDSGAYPGGSSYSGLSDLFGGTDGSSSMLESLFGSFLGGGGDFSGIFDDLDSSNMDYYYQDRSLPQEDMVDYISDNWFDGSLLRWNSDESGNLLLRLSKQQWSLVHNLQLNMFVDDGEGFIDLGLDNVFEFTEDGALICDTQKVWVGINGQAVAYYHESTFDDGENYVITGRVPAYVNGVLSDIILVFDNEHPSGYVAGVRPVYQESETLTVAKAQSGFILAEDDSNGFGVSQVDTTVLQPGDVIDFICDYYGYDGTYQESFYLGDQMVVPSDGELTVENVSLEALRLKIAYVFTDIYNQERWTESVDR